MAVCAKRYFFKGRVQGVGFRYKTQDLAARFPVRGYVQNLLDGRVEMYAEGEDVVLNALLQAIQEQFAGNIQSFEIQDSTILQLKGFEIRR
jgi:acylphosphatase